jgi:hypothetical protein
MSNTDVVAQFSERLARDQLELANLSRRAKTTPVGGDSQILLGAVTIMDRWSGLAALAYAPANVPTMGVSSGTLADDIDRISANFMPTLSSYVSNFVGAVQTLRTSFSTARDLTTAIQLGASSLDPAANRAAALLTAFWANLSANYRFARDVANDTRDVDRHLVSLDEDWSHAALLLNPDRELSTHFESIAASQALRNRAIELPSFDIVDTSATLESLGLYPAGTYSFAVTVPYDTQANDAGHDTAELEVNGVAQPATKRFTFAVNGTDYRRALYYFHAAADFELRWSNPTVATDDGTGYARLLHVRPINSNLRSPAGPLSDGIPVAGRLIDVIGLCDSTYLAALWADVEISRIFRLAAAVERTKRVGGVSPVISLLRAAVASHGVAAANAAFAARTAIVSDVFDPEFWSDPGHVDIDVYMLQDAYRAFYIWLRDFVNTASLDGVARRVISDLIGD